MNLSTAHLLIASLPEFPTLRESLAFQAIGLIVVFIALCSIWLLLELMGLYFRRRDSVAVESPVHAPSAEGAAVDPATAALITAAVHVSLGGNHRIHSITPAGSAREASRDR